MKRLFVSLCAALCLLPGAAQTASNQQVSRPKLVVGIVVDQMRWDYLYRYYSRYGEGGFKRLLQDGFSCENTMVNYVPTVTALGHTCIYTGSVPSIHGIGGNNYIVQSTGKEMYCTDDATVHGVGSDNAAGKMSPRNLLVTTVGDELRLATNFRSKTIGISLKDRASILPAGHTANAAYWFDSETGRWITSTYYMNDLPQWVKDVNATNPAGAYLKKNWETLYPINTYKESTADDTQYEKPFEAGKSPVFPVRLPQIFKKEGYGVIKETPFGNTITLDMAEKAIEAEKMGQGSETDFLAVSLSSTDYVGHRFGVNAIETEDTYLRLDKDLASFFSYLDKTVGKGNYTLFLTADHAAAHNATFMKDHNIPANNWSADKMKASLDSLVNAQFGVKGAVIAVLNYQVSLNRNKLSEGKADYQKVKDAIVEYLRQRPEVSYAVDMEHVATAPVPAIVRERILNGYNYKNSGSIGIVLNPAWYEGTSRGTTHSAWYPYDSHIPLIFMGWGVNTGKTNREVYMTDIAATVSALLHIQMPNGCIGTPITEVMK